MSAPGSVHLSSELKIPPACFYIAEAPEALRPLLNRLRAQLASALPGAEEVIAYKMPGFRIGQSIIAGYAAFSKQCGLYVSPSVQLHHGYVQAAPNGPFDSAACLLTLHFTPETERFQALREIHSRLKPGGVFVALHYSVSQDRAERDLWLSRCAAFAISSGIDPVQANASVVAIGRQLPILAPEQDEELMRMAGFLNIQTFYMGLAFRGWVAHA